MFKNIRKVLDEFEGTYNKIQNDFRKTTKEDEEVMQYFSIHLAKALMQDEYVLDGSVAKIILATKELSSEITVKVQ